MEAKALQQLYDFRMLKLEEKLWKSWVVMKSQEQKSSALTQPCPKPGCCSITFGISAYSANSAESTLGACAQGKIIYSNNQISTYRSFNSHPGSRSN